MKLTKKLEAEVLKAYHTIWDAYLKGDMRTFASILDENCYIIGSAAAEVFTNKKSAVKYYKSTAEQITGKAEFRNRKISVMPADKGFMVNEESDFYLLIDDQWTFYGPARISSLFHKKNNKWKVIHQHGSFPDSKTEGGEQVNTEKIKAENIQLRDAVKRRTVELEQKNRELEIESSLEKVRAQALGMYKPDDLLSVCKVLFKELSLLGFSEIRNAVIHTFNDEGNYLIDYDYSDLIGGIITTIPYSDQPVIKRFLKQIRKSDEAFAEVIVKGKELNEWKKFRKSGGQPDDPRLDKTSALYYYFHSVGTADIGISTFSSINEENLRLLKRFRNVFDLAYKRYTDITKAEAQVREAEIELALERVRARTMAMQEPSEFNEVIDVIGEQFLNLGFDIQWANFSAKGLDVSDGLDMWMFAVIPGLFRSADRLFIPNTHHTIFTAIEEALKDYQTTGKDFFIMTFDKTDKNSWLDHLHNTTTYKDLPSELIAIDYDKPGYTTSAVILRDTWLSIGKHDSLPFKDEQNAILRRFSVAFGQAYTRFLDLQKAEAQAREAQIEAALERTRTQSMLMQHSNELDITSRVFHEQLLLLGIHTEFSYVWLPDVEKNKHLFWATWSEEQNGAATLQSKSAIYDLDRTEPYTAECFRAWESDEPVHVYPVASAEVKNFFDLWSEIMGDAKKLKPEFFPDGLYYDEAFMKYGCFGIVTRRLLREDEKKILLRFTIEFERTYTRFLDLQKAEAQAKEAQIEASLERVRSRAMAMQTSEELNELIGTVFTELTKLDLVLTRCVILIYEGNEKGVRWWMANSEAPSTPMNFFVKYADLPFFNDYLKGWHERSLKWQYTLEGEDKIRTDNVLFNETELSLLPDFVIAGMKANSKVYLSASFNNYGCLNLASLEPLSDEHFDILLRFAKVFDLTYTRFNDLKLAEAQAREAKIEAALERVRSRTMAMHKSDELNETNTVVIQQIRSLDIRLYAFGIHICHIDEPISEAWMGDPVGGYMPKVIYNHSQDPLSIRMYSGWKEGKTLTVEELEGDALKEHFGYMITLVPDRSVFDNLVAPESLVFHFAYFTYGFLVFLTQEHCPEEHSIFKRLAKVFEQTYTRFLDLQTAETQARESEIELALERVRAKSMSMRHSDELADLVKILFKELTRIGFSVNACIIMTYDERTNDSTWWIANFDGVSNPVGLLVLNHSHEPYLAYLKEWKKQTPKWSYKLGGAEKKKWDQYIFKNSGLAALPDVVKTGMQSVKDVHLNVCFNKYASITFGSLEPMGDKDFDTLHRFAKVFEQSYTRFLDLQKAEAQTREAKIETALERVRSRSLAMHKSDELQEVVNTVFERLKELDVEMDSANIAIFKEGTRDYDYWIASPVQKRSASFHMPYIDLSLTRDLIAARESGKDFSTTAYSFEEKNEWFDYAFKHTDFEFLNEERKQFILNAPAIMVAIAFSKHTGVQVNRYSSKLLTEGEAEVLKRFSKVFEQAYIRFLDLEKAEAQANEARIEIALERIRARALAMHKSDELMEVAKVLWEQMALLGQPELEASVVHLYEEDPDHIHSWRAVSIGTDSHTKLTYGHMAIPKNSCGVVREWLTKFYSDLKEYTIEISGAKQKEWYDLLFKLAPDIINSMRQEKSIHEKRFYRFSKFSGGALLMVSKQEPSAEVTYLQGRAAVVFDLAYRRFSDLQKAEAQAKDAQIESSLERVRSKTMAMHSSQDVADTVSTIFDELVKLGIQTLRCGVGILHEGYQMELWTAKPDETGRIELFVGHLDMKLHPLLTAGYESWKDKRDSFSYELKGDDLIAYFNAINNYSDYHANYDIASLPPHIFHNLFNFNEGTLFAFSLNQLSAEASQIFKRFAGVFGQTYRRYLDLQKAEAQAREAKIEASLERVRAKAMAMHKSDDLHGAVTIMFEEFQKLNLDVLRCGIGILNKNSRTGTVWTTSVSDNGLAVQISANESFDTHPLMMLIYERWQKQEDLDYVLQGQDLIDYYRAMDASELKLPKSQLFFSDDELQPQYYYAAMFKAGGLYSFRDKPFAAEDKQIMKRFASVVNLTYNRFLDLQKAEAQAREAKIEASLERVRAKAMAMHKSEDLNSAVATVFEELDKLDLGVLRCGISILDKEKRTGDIWVTSITDQGSAVQVSGDESFDIHPLLQGAFEAWLKKEDFSYLLEGDDLAQYYKAVKAANFQLPESQMITSETDPMAIGFKQQYCFATPYGAGGLFAFRGTEFPEEAKTVMKRFASVFDLTYKRFLDLQKAEANAREAKIEAALERVRSRTMAMHKSDELSETAVVLFKQLSELGNDPDRFSIGIIDEDAHVMNVYATDQEGSQVNIRFKARFDEKTTIDRMYKGWKGKLKSDVIHLKGKDLEDWIKYLRDELGMAINIEHFKGQRFHNVAYFSQGWLNFTTVEPTSQETISLLERFAAVFNLTYRRFLDLQKAEANAREAQIEAGLERVRARTMAMHSSDDVSAATATMFTELEKLGIENFRGGIAILLQNRTQEVWSVNNLAEGKIVKAVGTFNIDDHSFWQHMYKEWQDKKEFLHYFLAGQEKEDYVKILSSLQNYLPQSLQQFPDVHFQVYYFGEGAVWTNSLQPHSEEDQQVMKRFTSVFSLTFRRYQDLKKAEAQAREAQIEAGLERVRARTMAMHSSDDVSTATATMFTELEKLGIESFRGGILTIRADQTMDVWSVNNLIEGKIVRAAGEFDMTMHLFWQQLYKGWVNKDEVLYFNMSGKDKEDYIRILDARRDYLPDGMQELPDSHIQSYYFGEGFVWTFTLQPHSEEDKQVMKKFASVFSLTFRRYQDLLKAEAQAREATIEAALEKVRGKAMAMHNSNDLTATASLVFTELRKLGISPLRCGVGILNKENRKALLYSAVASEEGDNLSQFGWVLLDINPILKSIYDHWIGGQDYFPVLTKEMLKAYYAHLKAGFEVPDEHKEYEQYGYFIAFSEGMFYGWTERPFTESEIKILKRFASVIDLTFRRYMELQKSEANAREAVKQAALDRVRAEIASMRTVGDLERITPLIWNELTILGIPFIRCGVFIMDEEQQLIHTFLSTPDGKAIAAFHLPYTTPGNIQQILNNWRNKKNYIDHWDEAAFTEFAGTLVKQGVLASPEQYLKTLPKGGFYLHFLPFLQGMLYVGNTTQLGEEEIELIQHVADAFATAYARYEDFNRLEAAKQQVEKTLTDLKQAQTQLVQSEKMASLGELTAGIAHEIQNPLNFVNNFSDVSNELLEEMKTELKKGNAEDAMAIVEDIKQNLDKILHHGKRADAIVKGMLQHSRTSSGQKEPTDINILADEYLRLAFHGLRAKDKSFNAKFETDFDNNIGKINIIPQDIGRVILNLINNAFYAVTEKKKHALTGSAPNGYDPVVTVITKKENGKVEIKVRDNGNGIPQKVLDKIFQPFFTTKPTGQGTGLGLSLSYDIIKAHGGELKVETKEGDGAEFIIQIPMN